ncbi:MAG: rhodanese-like domain-containing protein [Bacteroidia bacterium]|jgi:rhodanese-related sulfurtransferase|nr:rhodanese-like domain-containing protein [Bacteroidia bacterium]
MTDITVIELKERLDKGEKPVIIDVREVHEYEEYNIGATLIPLGELPGRIEELAAYKQQEVIVHCRSGARSATAKMFLLDNGFEQVRNLMGGMLAWRELE